MSTDPTTPTSSPEPSPYIRTYAKDVAALTGTQPATANSTGVPAAAASTRNTQTTASSDGVLLPSVDESLVTSTKDENAIVDLAELEKNAERLDGNTQQDLYRASQPEAVREEISLPKIIPGDIVSDTSSAIASALAPDGNAEAPKDENRENILQRLRARVAGHASSQDQVAPVAAPAIEYSTSSMMPPISEQKPSAIPAPISVEPPPPAVISTPAPEAAPLAIPAPTESASAPIHTYSSDFANHIDEKKASTFSVLAAEKDAKPRVAAEAKSKSNLLPVVAGIVLILAGGTGIVMGYIYFIQRAPVALAPTPVSLITPDQRVTLTGSGSTLIDAIAQQVTQSIPVNSVTALYVASTTITTQDTNGGDLIDALQLPAPDILLRNIDPSSTVGIINAGSQTRPFFIFRVTSFERTFSGMLTWESTIEDDLARLYPLYTGTPQSAAAASSSTPATASTNSPTSAAANAQIPTNGQFIDEVVASHDTRALKDIQGNTILIYGYADKQTLIIARNEAAFTLLLTRLNAGSQ